MMRRIGLFLAVLLLLLVYGPRPRVAVPAIAAIAAGVPNDVAAIPAYLAREEGAVPGVHENTEKRVVFADTTAPRRTHYSVVYLHGFSATRQETAPLSERVASALGANLFETRLSGHGLSGDAMGRATAGDWIADAEEAFTVGQRLGDSVIVIATSTGGTLALWLAAQPDSVKRALKSIVLISPNLAIKDPASRFLTWPWMQTILPRVMPERRWSSKNKEQERYWTTAYPTAALFPLAALVRDVRGIDRRMITTPLLVFTNRNDDVVDESATTDFLRGVTNAHVERVDVTPATGEDRHVIVGRILSPSQVEPFFTRVLAFVR